MPDEQSIVHREHPKNESHAWGVSLRGWIALMIAVTFCCLALTRYLTPEQFLSVVTFVLGYYFGKQQTTK